MNCLPKDRHAFPRSSINGPWGSFRYLSSKQFKKIVNNISVLGWKSKRISEETAVMLMTKQRLVFFSRHCCARQIYPTINLLLIVRACLLVCVRVCAGMCTHVCIRAGAQIFTYLCWWGWDVSIWFISGQITVKCSYNITGQNQLETKYTSKPMYLWHIWNDKHVVTWISVVWCSWYSSLPLSLCMWHWQISSSSLM